MMSEEASCIVIIGIAIWFIVTINLFIPQKTAELTTNQIRRLEQIDQCNVLEDLIVTAENVLTENLKQQMSIEAMNLRAVIWDDAPSSGTMEPYFNKNFKIIRYDKTYEDLSNKKFDYSAQYTLSLGKIWEKFIFIRVGNKFVTIFLSYTMKYYADSIDSDNIEKFCSEALKRMFNKTFILEQNLYHHGLSSDQDKSKGQYFLIQHGAHEGFREKIISSIEDGLDKQEEVAKDKQSSCIMKIQNGQMSLHSIRYSINLDFTYPDFHAYCEKRFQKQYHTIKKDL